MTAEEELKTFKVQLQKRARVTASVFGTLAIITLITLVYALFQQTQANRERIHAEQDRTQAMQEVILLKKQILVGQERLLACEKARQELKSESKKLRGK